MIRTANNRFRSGADTGNPTLPGNVVDLLYASPYNSTNYACGWTAGAGQIDAITGVRQTAEPWDVIAFSITAQLVLAQNTLTPNTAPLFGKWGKILAGLTTAPATVGTGAGSFPFCQYSLPPLPIDQSKIASLFDPASDNLPPTLAANPPYIYMPVSASLVLPQPMRINGGDTVGVGIWMLPSLLSAYDLLSTDGPGTYMMVYNAAYSITYDDNPDNGLGQGPT